MSFHDDNRCLIHKDTSDAGFRRLLNYPLNRIIPIRAAYTVRFKKAIYALHCFQKKSPRGIKTAKPDVDLIQKRLQAAKDDYEARYGKGTK